MRRPVSVLLLAFAGGILLQYWAEGAPFLLAPAAGAAVLLRRRRTAALFLLAVFLGAACFLCQETRSSPLLSCEGQTVSLWGRVVSVAEKEEDYYQLTLKGECWQPGGLAREDEERYLLGEKVLVRLSGELEGAETSVLGSMEGPQELVGRQVCLRGSVSLPDGQKNPGLFDYRLYLKTRGIAAILSCRTGHLEVTSEGSAFWNGLAMWKARFTEALTPHMSREALAVLTGMLFGDKEPLGDELYEVFQKNGVGHLLAVSGIHVGVIYLYADLLLRRRGGPAASLAALPLLLFYAALASFSPSVVRAVVMISSHLLARLLRRRYDLLCCASFSAFLMLLQNPYNLFSLGFQLSFLAVFCLAFLLPPMQPWAQRLKRRGGLGLWQGRAVEWAGPLLAIQAGMAPVTAYLFNYFSLASFLLNPPAIFLAGFLIPVAMLLLPLSLLGGPLLALGAIGAALPAELLLQMNLLAYRPGLSVFNAVSPPAGLLALCYGLLFFVASEQFWRFLRRRDFRRMAAVLLALLLAASSFFVFVPGCRDAQLVFVDVGQGDCLHIRTPSGKNVLIDGGGSADYDVGRNVLLPYLLKQGVDRIDLAIVTHLHQDHYGGIA
ncbi:MAG: ComEC/Rec2 family competence protein, partial [Bacillota bacterium]|nr:ComEC/Rec2 family competence protein [Bacillota bacterium]